MPESIYPRYSYPRYNIFDTGGPYFDTTPRMRAATGTDFFREQMEKAPRLKKSARSILLDSFDDAEFNPSEYLRLLPAARSESNPVGNNEFTKQPLERIYNTITPWLGDLTDPANLAAGPASKVKGAANKIGKVAELDQVTGAIPKEVLSWIRSVSKSSKAKKKVASEVAKKTEASLPVTPSPTQYGVTVRGGDPRLPTHYRDMSPPVGNIAQIEALAPSSVLKGRTVTPKPSNVTGAPKIPEGTLNRSDSLFNPFEAITGDFPPAWNTDIDRGTHLGEFIGDLTPGPSNPNKFTDDLDDLSEIGAAAGMPKPSPASIPPKKIAPREVNGIFDPNRPVEVGSTAPNPLFKVKNDWFRSIRSRLRGDSKAGQVIDDLYTAYRTDKGVWGGTKEQEYLDIFKGIDKKTFAEQVVPHLEAGTLPDNPKVAAAIEKFRKFDEEMVNTVLANKIKIRSQDGKELVDWTPHSNYWPHIYPQGFWDDADNIAQAIAKKYDIPLELAQQTAQRASAHGGKLILEPERMGKEFAKRYGQNFKSWQKTRNLNLEGYRTDPEAYLIHIRDVADRLAMNRYFGPKDIASGPTEGMFGKLLSEIKDPEIRNKLLVRVFNREMGPTASKGQRALAEGVIGAETLGHLSNFALNNPQQLASLFGQATPKALMKAAGSAFTRGSRLRFGRESGALTPVHSDAMFGEKLTAGNLGDILSKTASKAFGMKASEEFTRSVSAVAGRETALDLFNRLKKNPNNQRLRQRLEYLTLDKADNLLGQDMLSPDQLKKAGARMSELSQGRAQAIDLPYHATGGEYAPTKNLLGLFKKYAYIQPGLMARSLRTTPLQTALAGTGAYALGGLGLGYLKDAKRAAVDSVATGADFGRSFEDLRQERGSLAEQLAKAPLEGWMFGMPAEIGRRAFMNNSKLTDTIMPVVGSDINRIWDTGKNYFGARTERKANETLSKEALKWVPFIGYDLAASLYPKKTRNKSIWSE